MAAEHEVELPREVGGVADAGAHALAGERRHQVGGVAGERRPARAATARRTRAWNVYTAWRSSRALPGCTSHGASSSQAAASSLSSSSVSCGQAHELPPPPAGPAGHGGGRPGRVADLQVDRVEHARLVEDDVDDQPVVEEPEVAHRQAGERAHRAVGAVAADDVPALDLGAVGRGDHDDAVVVLRRARRPRRRGGLDARQLAGPRGRGSASSVGWLNIDDAGQPDGAVADATEAQQRRARGVAPLVDVGRLADRRAARRRCPQRLEDAADLVVEVHRAGQRVRLGPPLEHHDRAPELGRAGSRATLPTGP